MKLVFAMVDGGGNVPPQLAVARTLQARGAQILVIGHHGIRDRVHAAGLAFQPFSEEKHFDPTIRRSLPAIMAEFTRVAADRDLGRQLVQAASRHHADAVIVDMLLAGGIGEVLNAGLSPIVFVHCFYRTVQDLAASPAGWYLRLRGADPMVAEHRGLLQIVAARADLDPLRGAPPVRHTGVIWQGIPSAAIPRPVPRVLVSLSTNAFAGQRKMLQNILDAVAPLPLEVTVTVGPAIDACGLRVPQNTTVHRWLNHDDVLTTTSLVVGHGGHSTAMRALSFGIPQIVMPANPMIDQKRVGAALERVGAGILLPKHAGAKRIRKTVERVLQDDSYREAASRLGEEIRRNDGAVAAADAICEYIRARTQFANP